MKKLLFFLYVYLGADFIQRPICFMPTRLRSGSLDRKLRASGCHYFVLNNDPAPAFPAMDSQATPNPIVKGVRGTDVWITPGNMHFQSACLLRAGQPFARLTSVFCCDTHGFASRADTRSETLYVCKHVFQLLHFQVDENFQ